MSSGFWFTIWPVVVGIALGMSGGIPLGYIIGRHRRTRRVI